MCNIQEFLSKTMSLMDGFRNDMRSVFPGKITHLTEWMVCRIAAQKHFKMNKQEAEEFTSLYIKEHNGEK